jgi:hypothetical protein
VSGGLEFLEIARQIKSLSVTVAWRPIAPMVEQRIPNPLVVGSSPTRPAKFLKDE